jgi:hypothetical protein
MGGYLRGQADALGLPVLDTSRMSIEAVADGLHQGLVILRSAATSANVCLTLSSAAPLEREGVGLDCGRRPQLKRNPLGCMLW